LPGSTLMTDHPDMEQGDLVGLMRDYVAAVDELDNADPRQSESLAEIVIQRRLALFRALADAGWSAPADVATALELDDVVAHMSMGAAAKLT
jgi:hypothetical protein